MITYAEENHRLRIYMKGLIHLDIFKVNYQGIQSFIDTKYFGDRNLYCIEIYQHNGTVPVIEVGYVERIHWEKILEVIGRWANKI